MTVSAVLDAAGRRRSPATMPGYHAGRAPRNKGKLYPADPPTVEEIIAVMRRATDDRHGWRLRALIVVLWRGGLRVQEALALGERDLDPRRGSLLARTAAQPLRDFAAQDPVVTTGTAAASPGDRRSGGFLTQPRRAKAMGGGMRFPRIRGRAPRAARCPLGRQRRYRGARSREWPVRFEAVASRSEPTRASRAATPAPRRESGSQPAMPSE
jgi:hypothetical protein